MHSNEYQPCESIDASVFTGDFLENNFHRAEFRLYVERWLRALDSRDQQEISDNARRKMFEAEWEKTHSLPINSRRHADGRYGVAGIQSAWEDWDATN